VKHSDLGILRCPSCSGPLELAEFTRDEGLGTVAKGVLSCPACRIYFIIDDGIPFLIDASYYNDYDFNGFASTWEERFDFQGYRLFRKEACPGKMGQVSFFNQDSEVYDDDVAGSTFWRATDANIFGSWLEDLSRDAAILDIGCGGGRCSIPLAKSGKRVLATDISLGMLRQARRKAREEGVGTTTFFLADAENLPIANDSFDAVISYGMLHHVEEPANILRGVAGILRSQGRFYALENHASHVRFIFDWMMRRSKLWDEEAGTHPLFTSNELIELGNKVGLRPDTSLHIFIPPHLVNKLEFGKAKLLLSLTDAIFGRIPLLKGCAGQVVLKAHKP